MLKFNITTADCLRPGSDTPDDPCDDTPVDPACLDLEYAADHPDACPNASAITGLVVVPPSGTTEVGGHYPFKAMLTFANGQERDVSAKAAWSTGNSGVALIVHGEATGVSIGTTTIEASYRGHAATATLTVIASCLQASVDLVLVMDRSASMNLVGDDGQTRLEGCKQAAIALVENLNFLKDECAVVSFAGIIDGGVKSPSADLNLILSPVKADVDGAIGSITVHDDPDSYTGIGAGLQKAFDELTAHGRAGSRKLIVVLTDGMENICTPNPATVAAAIKAANITIVVVALATEDVSTKDCSNASTTVNTYLASLCSCSLFYTAATPEDLVDIMSRIPNVICNANSVGCLYYVTPPVTPPVPPTCASPCLDYGGFQNWDVVQGFVDLIGMGTNLVALYDVWPGNGLYVDMVGTDQGQPDYKKAQAVGAIQTKQSFSLAPGRYRVSMYISGNSRQDRTGDKLQVSLGDLWNATVQVDNYLQYFRLYGEGGGDSFGARPQWDINITSPTSAKLKITHLPLPAGAIPTIGLIIDRVKFVNMNTAEVLLYDDFDSENPCP